VTAVVSKNSDDELEENEVVVCGSKSVPLYSKQYKSTTRNKAAQNRWFKNLTIKTQPVSEELEEKCAVSYWYQINKHCLSEEDRKLLKQYLTLDPANAHIFRTGGHATADMSRFSLFKETEKNVLVPRFFGIAHWGVPKYDHTSLGLPASFNFGGRLLNDPPQVKVVNTALTALLKHNHGGCVSLPCGFGMLCICFLFGGCEVLTDHVYP
jgi:hypothetical protein